VQPWTELERRLEKGEGNPLSTAVRPWRATVVLAGSIWLGFTLLRWVALATTEFAQPDHGQLADGVAGWANLPNHYDASWLIGIAESGYDTDGAPMNRAFFPGYPLLIRGLALLLGLGSLNHAAVLAAALLLTSISCLVATTLVLRIAEDQWGRRAGPFAATLLMAWPTATFLTALYSEPVYLAFASASWWAGCRRRWWLAGGLCAAASLIRINGLFLLAALLVMFVVSRRRDAQPFAPWPLVGLGVGSLGTVAYAVYLWWATGEWSGWFGAQAVGWGRHLAWPWTSLGTTVDRAFGAQGLAPEEVAQHVVDIVTVIAAIGLLVYLARRRLWPELTLTFVTLSVLVTSTYYLSVARNTLTILPVFVVGGWLLSWARPTTAYAILGVSTMWMVGTTVLFRIPLWAG